MAGQNRKMYALENYLIDFVFFLQNSFIFEDELCSFLTNKLTFIFISTFLPSLSLTWNCYNLNIIITSETLKYTWIGKIWIYILMFK